MKCLKKKIEKNLGKISSQEIKQAQGSIFFFFIVNKQINKQLDKQTNKQQINIKNIVKK